MDRIKLNTQGLAEATAAFTPSPIAGSASAISRPPKDVRRRKNFSAPMTADQYTLQIGNIKLLPGGKFVLAHRCNICIKLLHTQRTLQISRQYYAAAAVNKQTLAVGCWIGSGDIDWMALEGQILCWISSSVCLHSILHGHHRG
ncbi:hypothetical protein PoB_004904700 [Plakobranchus ocellatus]|uniref:Uncharacterized protein n=1 Tax=Plakobranchus ocellatus TaxID=259542 RepID=A0AAV4BT80_9GAST|nr:hypothetical protein PoB_004904700 [Plakobranchus ocellatus]